MSNEPELLIDPGHGGRDPGGGSNQHWKEKDLVLKISLYQEKRFKQLGVKVALTRRDDRTIEPSERVKIVKGSGAKYCISNHINAGGGDGAETIHSAKSSKALAQAIVDEIQKEGQNIRRVFTRTMKSGDDYYFMHRNTGHVETVIVEYGFADSTRDDVEQLRKHWEKYAEAVVRGFCKHTGKKYTPPTSVAAPAPVLAPATKPKGSDQRDINKVTPWAASSWKEAQDNGYFDGTRPGAPITREEAAVIVNRLRRNFLILISGNSANIADFEKRLSEIEKGK